MILKRRAALDGVQLDEVDSRILIQKIEPAAGKEKIESTVLWNGSGSRMTGFHRESLDIEITFSINEKSYRPGERAGVLEKANRWAAAGGMLTVGYKPGRQIRVIAAQLPGEGDAMNRNQYTITFRAFGVPFWQESEPGRVRITGSSGSAAFGVNGNQETVMNASFRNTGSGTINTLTINAGGIFKFQNLGLGPGETLTIDHPDDGRRSLLRIRIGSRSAMAARTADSSHDLTIQPGIRTVSFTAGGSGTMEFSCSGRFA